MKNFINVLILLFIISTQACKQKEQNVEFKLKVSNSVNLSDIFKVEKKLQVKYEKPVAPIEVLKPFNTPYLALIDGNICKIDEKGNLFQKLITPENAFMFNGISNFEVYNKKIYSVERGIKKIKIIDDKFQILKNYDIPFYVLSLKIISDNIVLLYIGFDRTDTDTHQIVLYDLEKNKILGKYLEVNENLNYFNFKTKNNFFSQDNQIYFSNGIDNNLYQYDKDGMKVILQMDYGSNAMPADFYPNSRFSDVQEYIEHTNTIDKVSRFYGFIKFQNYILKTISYGKNRYFVFKNLVTGQEYTTENIQEDILNSGVISTQDDYIGMLGEIENQFAIYVENNKYSSDSTFVGTLLLGKFKF